jgi:hypothetical protein
MNKLFDQDSVSECCQSMLAHMLAGHISWLGVEALNVPLLTD